MLIGTIQSWDTSASLGGTMCNCITKIRVSGKLARRMGGHLDIKLHILVFTLVYGLTSYTVPTGPVGRLLGWST